MEEQAPFKSKIHGIDSRVVKCCDTTNPNTIEAGISFDCISKDVYGMPLSHFDGTPWLHQTTKTMYLDRTTARQLIDELRGLKFPRKKRSSKKNT